MKLFNLILTLAVLLVAVLLALIPLVLIPSPAYANSAYAQQQQTDNSSGLQPDSPSDLREQLTALEAQISELKLRLKSQEEKIPFRASGIENFDPDLVLKPFWHNNGRNRGSGNEAGFDLITDLGFKLRIEDTLTVYLQSRLRSQRCEFSRNYDYEFSLTNCYRPREEPVSLRLGYLDYRHHTLGDYKIGIVPTIFEIDRFYDYRYLCIGAIDSELIPSSDIGIRWDKTAAIGPNSWAEFNLLLTNGEGDAVTNSNSACGAGGSSRISYRLNHGQDLFSLRGLAYTGKKYSTPIKELFDVVELQTALVKKLSWNRLDLGDLEMKGTYCWYRRGFREEELDPNDISTYGYSQASQRYLIDIIRKGAVGIIDYRAINIDLEYTPFCLRRKFSIIGNWSQWRDNDGRQDPIRRLTLGFGIRIREAETHTLRFLGFWAHTSDDLLKDPSDRKDSYIMGFHLVIP